MRRDLAGRRRLRRSTAALMWGSYAVHGLAMFATLRRGAPLPLPRSLTIPAGTVLAGFGGACLFAGARRFDGPAQLTGTAVQPLLTGGIYGYSRNPQYVGYTLLLTGAAVGCRNAGAMVLVTLLGASYVAWVPVEEEHLVGVFGDAYLDYQGRIARWWGTASVAREEGLEE